MRDLTRRAIALWSTTALGLLGIVVLAIWMLRVGALDGLTLIVLGLVVGLWFALQLVSWHWQRNLRTDTPDVPKHLVVRIAGVPRLPEGTAEDLANAEMRRREAPAWLGLGATTLISLGLAGTFLGLTLGLMNALPYLEGERISEGGECIAGVIDAAYNVDCAIKLLLEGAKLAFVKSLAGIVLALLWNFRLLEVRRAEDALRSALVDGFNEHPPLTVEWLLAESISRMASKLSELQRSNIDNAEQRAHARVKREDTVDRMFSTVMKHVSALNNNFQVHNRSMCREFQALRGDDAATLTAIHTEFVALRDTVNDLGDALPEQIGTHAGVQVGETLQPKLENLTQVLQALGTTGTTAIGDAFKSNMADEVTQLQQALLNVTAAMVQLPAQLADGGRIAARTLDTASQTGAKQLSDAAAEVATHTRAASDSVEHLKWALAETQTLVAALQTGGDQLSRSFAEVSRPLQALPTTLESARSGIEQAGDAARTAANELDNAGTKAATALADAAGKMEASADTAGVSFVGSAQEAASVLTNATTEAGATLSGAARQAGQAIQAGGSRLAGQVENAGELLRDGIASELITIRDSLRAQRDAQQTTLEAWREERETVFAGSEAARVRLSELQQTAHEFTEGVETLRAACAATVEQLGKVTGSQQRGADQAIADLLAAVKTFSDALSANQRAIQVAGLQSVATTEQVTAAAARQVAEALTKGADGLAKAMARAEQLGRTLADHSDTLQRGLVSANVTASALEKHGQAMVYSGTQLRQELEGVTAPLIVLQGGLGKVAPAVESAARAMEDERRALSGLGEALKEQASLIRQQETALATRTTELRRLHEVLGQQWSGHVGRMSQAHETVKAAWQEAMRAAASGLEGNARAVATYAEKVERSLGLNDNVVGLQSSLADVADTLGELTPVLKVLGREVTRLRGAVDRLDEVDV